LFIAKLGLERVPPLGPVVIILQVIRGLVLYFHPIPSQFLARCRQNDEQGKKGHDSEKNFFFLELHPCPMDTKGRGKGNLFVLPGIKF
jgi:hypothetical protein